MTDETSFYISELRFKSDNAADVVVAFGRGLNVVSGFSDTGKTLILDAINFVFGASKPLRSISERGSYNRILVEFCTYAGRVHTAERLWGGGDILLYYCRASDVTSDSLGVPLSAKHDPTKDETISHVLLRLCGLSDYYIRTNKRGSTRLFSFRDLVEYSLVTFQRIVTEFSPIHSGQYTEKTAESSVFRSLLTGSDDSGISAGSKPLSIKAKSDARKEMFQQFRNDLDRQIAGINIPEETVLNNARQIDSKINEHIESIRELTNNTVGLEEERLVIWRQKERTRSRRDEVLSLISRFELLDRKYSSDLDRLNANNEVGLLLSDFEEDVCPLCGAPLDNHKHDVLLNQDDLDKFSAACAAEAEKIHELQRDLRNTIQALSSEAAMLAISTSQLEEQFSTIATALKAVVEPKVSSLNTDLAELIRQRNEVERQLALHNELKRLNKLQYDSVTLSQARAVEQKFDGVSSTDYDLLAQSIRDILQDWDYPNLGDVEFDVAKEDIKISGQNRSAYGTGYKAITYAAFTVAMLSQARKFGLPHPGFVILDAPLVTYRQPDEKMGRNLKDAFYRNLATIGESVQVIILEQEVPPSDVLNAITHIPFTKDKTTGRYGLFPV